MNIIFEVKGGIGKHVAATAVCEGIKNRYPDADLIVVSAYPEVFINNPNVKRSLGFGQLSYFYSQFIEGKEFLVFKTDPYDSNSYLHQQKHLIECWFEQFGLIYNNEQPRIYLTQREIDFHQKKLPTDKPLLMLQTNGGAADQPLKYSWARDMPKNIAEAVIKQFSKEYHILHIRRDDQLAYENTLQVKDDFRAIAAMMLATKKRVFIDSFAQHTAAALRLPSMVLWVANKPEVFGYDLHTNITAKEFNKEPELRNSYLNRFSIIGDPLEFPYQSEDHIFIVDQVLKAIYGESAELLTNFSVNPAFGRMPDVVPEVKDIEHLNANEVMKGLKEQSETAPMDISEKLPENQ